MAKSDAIEARIRSWANVVTRPRHHDITTWLRTSGRQYTNDFAYHEECRVARHSRPLLHEEMRATRAHAETLAKLVTDAQQNDERERERREDVYAKNAWDPERLARIKAADELRAQHRELYTHALMVARDAEEQGDYDRARRVLVAHGMSEAMAMRTIVEPRFASDFITPEAWRQVNPPLVHRPGQDGVG